MRTGIAVIALLLAIGIAPGQERVPDDRAQEIAKVCAEQAAKVTGLALKTEVDPQKPFGLHAGGRAGMIIPDKKLTADLLAKAEKEVIPVGQLWLRKIAPLIDGKVTPNDKLQIVTVTAGGEDHALPLCLLGVQKNAKGGLELLVYGKGKEPLVRVPLKKVDAKQELPVELEAKRGDNDTATLTLNLLGKYQATLTLGEQAP